MFPYWGPAVVAVYVGNGKWCLARNFVAALQKLNDDDDDSYDDDDEHVEKKRLIECRWKFCLLPYILYFIIS